MTANVRLFWTVREYLGVTGLESQIYQKGSLLSMIIFDHLKRMCDDGEEAGMDVQGSTKVRKLFVVGRQ